MTEPPALFKLPVELQRDIFDLLPYPNLLVLHATHRHFRLIIDIQKIQASTPRSTLVEELFDAARSDAFFVKQNQWACTNCLSLRPQHQFADKQRKGKSATRRFCIPCGLRGRYRPGARIGCMGTPGVYCYVCKIFKQGPAEVLGSMCADCVDYSRRPKAKDNKREVRREIGGAVTHDSWGWLEVIQGVGTVWEAPPMI